MIDARSLHEWLEVGRDFSNWLKNRIKEYGFDEGSDYSPVLAKSPGRSRPRKDYLLTIDMAKELSMIERTDKGRRARPGRRPNAHLQVQRHRASHGHH